ncbi:acyl carrier protein [Micromonospora lupini]|uniref:acyl carrier protein n=1 Tax=Micromonospora lupini TaxID=285679 RepID=UPI0033FF3D1A
MRFLPPRPGADTGVSLLEQVRSIIATRRPLGDDTNFFEAGFTSSSLTAVLADLENAALSLSLVDLYRFPTIRALANELRRRAAAAAPAPTTGPRPLPWERHAEPQGGH